MPWKFWPFGKKNSANYTVNPPKATAQESNCNAGSTGEAHFLEGKEFVKHEDFRQALAAFNRALIADPDNLQYQREFDEASDAMMKMAQSNRLLHAQPSMKVTDHFAESFGNIARGTFANAEALYIEGKQYALAGNHSAAIECFKDAINLDHTKPKYGNKLALSYYYGGNIEAAEAIAKELISLAPRYGPAYDTLSHIYRFKAKAEGLAQETVHALENEALGYLKLYKKYTKGTDHTLGYHLERAAVSIKGANPKDANKHLGRVIKEMEKYNSHPDKIGPDMSCLGPTENLSEQLALFKELKSSTESSKKIGKITIRTKSDMVSPELGNVVEKAATAFKFGMTQSAIRELKNEINSLKQGVVKREEVSFAISSNSALELEKNQMAKINSDHFLKEYFNAFMFTINQAHTSAMVVTKGDMVIDTSNFGQDLAIKALSLIPFCGSFVSDTVQDIAEFVRDTKIKNKATAFAQIANGAVELHNIISPIVRDITLDPSIFQKIATAKQQIQEKSLFGKLLSHITEVGKKVINKIYLDMYDTDAKQLGYEHACMVISEWVKQIENHNNITQKELSRFIKELILPDHHEHLIINSPSYPMPELSVREEDNSLIAYLLGNDNVPESLV